MDPRSSALDHVFPFVSLAEFDVLARVLRNETRTANGKSLGIYIETKTPSRYRDEFGIDIERIVVDTLNAGGFWLADDGDNNRRVLFESFELDSLRRLKTLSTKPRIFLVDSVDIASNISAYSDVADGVGIDKHLLSPSPQGDNLMKLFHENNLLVHVWTFRQFQKFWKKDFKSFEEELIRFFNLK